MLGDTVDGRLPIGALAVGQIDADLQVDQWGWIVNLVTGACIGNDPNR